MSILDCYKRKPFLNHSALLLRSFNQPAQKKQANKTANEQKDSDDQNKESYDIILPNGQKIEKNKKYKVGERLREQMLETAKEPPKLAKKSEIKKESKYNERIIDNLSKSMNLMFTQ